MVLTCCDLTSLFPVCPQWIFVVCAQKMFFFSSVEQIWVQVCETFLEDKLSFFFFFSVVVVFLLRFTRRGHRRNNCNWCYSTKHCSHSTLVHVRVCQVTHKLPG